MIQLKLNFFYKIKRGIESQRINTVKLISNDEKVIPARDNNGKIIYLSLREKKLAGAVIFDPNKIDFTTYLSKDPLIYNTIKDQTTYLIRTEYRPMSENEYGVVAIHEIAGHGYNYINNPRIQLIENDRLTEEFETRIRNVYMVEKYSSLERFINKFIPSFIWETLPKDAKKPIKGKTNIHK